VRSCDFRLNHRSNLHAENRRRLFLAQKPCRQRRWVAAA
jgi:hypothetical protein